MYGRTEGRILIARYHPCSSSALSSIENRTTFLGVSTEDAESLSALMGDGDAGADEPLFIGSSRRDMLRCSLVANALDSIGRDAVELLRLERGVEGPVVEVRVDNEASESEGVRVIERDDPSAELGFLSDDRAGGGGRATLGGADTRLLITGCTAPCEEAETLGGGASFAQPSRWRVRACMW